MVKGVLLDSVVLIDHLNGIQAAADYLASLRRSSTPVWISAITRAEVLAGTQSDYEFGLVSRLLSEFEFAPLSSDVADSAAELRRTIRLRLPDAFQLACAQNLDLKLATRNTRDFSENDPRIEVPYTL
jgi:predicted nucleic acid-binding protein